MARAKIVVVVLALLALLLPVAMPWIKTHNWEIGRAHV